MEQYNFSVTFLILKSILCHKSDVSRCHLVTHSNAVLLLRFSNRIVAVHCTSAVSYTGVYAGCSPLSCLGVLPGEIAPKSDFWSLGMQDLLKILG